jgi:predicted RecB family endonuclease
MLSLDDDVESGGLPSVACERLFVELALLLDDAVWARVTEDLAVSLVHDLEKSRVSKVFSSDECEKTLF